MDIPLLISSVPEIRRMKQAVSGNSNQDIKLKLSSKRFLSCCEEFLHWMIFEKFGDWLKGSSFPEEFINSRIIAEKRIGNEVGGGGWLCSRSQGSQRDHGWPIYFLLQCFVFHKSGALLHLNSLKVAICFHSKEQSFATCGFALT